MTINLTTSNNRLLEEVLKEALNEGYIDIQRYKTLCIEYRQLIDELVLLFNHKQSTSVHQEHYLRISHAISYYFNHAFYNKSLRDLKTESIHNIVDLGIHEVNNQVKNIQNLLESIKLIRIKTTNERYNSILDEQIPRFLHSYDEYRYLFNACVTNEDLDYPLFDGIPMDHDMYQLEGTDLIEYYLNRLFLESKICNMFKNEIVELLQLFEQQKGIEITLLNLNFTELILNQLIVSVGLHKQTLILEKNDVENFKLLYSIDKVREILEVVLSMFPEELKEYLNLFKKQLLFRFKQFYENNYDLLIYRIPVENNLEIKLYETVEDHIFDKYLSDLRMMSEAEDKINYLKKNEIGFLDILDIFDYELFIDEEYIQYFKSLESIELAIFIKYINRDLNAFNQKVTINSKFLEELDNGEQWVGYLIAYLRQLENDELVKIENAINNIKLVNLYQV